FPSRGLACRTTTAFNFMAAGTTTTQNEIPVRVRFTYAPPDRVPIDWPAGNWCTSLRTRVQYAVTRSSAELTTHDVLDRRRACGDKIAKAVENDLRVSGVRIGSVSVRIELAPGSYSRIRALWIAHCDSTAVNESGAHEGARLHCRKRDL